MMIARIVLLAQALAALALGWIYFRRWRLVRPPVGVLNLWDVVFMMAAILLIPYLYLALPNWAVVGVLAVETVGVVYLLAEPLVRAGPSLFLIGGFVACADIVANLRFGSTSPAYLAVHDGVLVLITIAVANLWTQSGLRARDLAILAAALTAYDFIFTSRLSLMTDLFIRVQGMPLAPLLAWPGDGLGQWVALGLGDLLMLCSSPLIFRKAFGRVAGFLAATLGFLVVLGIMLLPLKGIFPVMTVLGPSTVLQYLFWRRRGSERNMQAYLLAEPTD